MVIGRCCARGMCRDGGAGKALVGASGCVGCTRFSSARRACCGEPSYAHTTVSGAKMSTPPRVGIRAAVIRSKFRMVTRSRW